MDEDKLRATSVPDQAVPAQPGREDRDGLRGRSTTTVLALVRLAMQDKETPEELAGRLRAEARGDEVLLRLALGRVSRAMLRVPTPAGLRAAEVLRRAIAGLEEPH